MKSLKKNISTESVVNFCNEFTHVHRIADYPDACNGLQFANRGTVKKIGAAVDAGIEPFKAAIAHGVDFLIVHHGLFWSKPTSITGPLYEKYKLLLENNLAVYGCHLPLDAHPQIGNNALIAKHLAIPVIGNFLINQGTPIGMIAKNTSTRLVLRSKLQKLFPKTFKAIEYGSPNPKKIAICSGNGTSAVDEMIRIGVDTLITGELRQHHFNQAQEHKLNLYPCGHYATEVFGVQALAQKVAKKFNLPYTFIEMDCIL